MRAPDTTTTFPPPLPRTALWQGERGDKQAYVTVISEGRYRAVVWTRGVGMTGDCPHRHTSVERAFECAKQQLFESGCVVVRRTQ